MIYELSRDIETLMRNRKFPVVVRYGPERAKFEPGHGSAVILIERDREQGDSHGPARGAAQNPRHRYTRTLACVATFYAKSGLSGARVGNHEALCEKLIDGFSCALYEWASTSKAVGTAFGSGQYLSASEFADLETWPGVVYRLRFSVPRGVVELDYTSEKDPGSAAPEAEAPPFSNTTHVFLTGAPDGSDPETGCGA